MPYRTKGQLCMESMSGIYHVTKIQSGLTIDRTGSGENKSAKHC